MKHILPFMKKVIFMKKINSKRKIFWLCIACSAILFCVISFFSFNAKSSKNSGAPIELCGTKYSIHDDSVTCFNGTAEDFEKLTLFKRLREVWFYSSLPHSAVVFKKMRYLESLYVNKLNDVSVLKGLPRLSYLKIKLSENSDEQMKELLQIKTLRSLNVSNYSEKNCTINFRKSRIRYLGISDSNCEILNFEGKMHALREIGMGETKTRKINGLSAAKYLRRISIGDTQLENLDFVRGLRKLKQLEVFHSKLNNIDAIENTRSLRLLMVPGNPIVHLPVMTFLKNLVVFSIRGTKIEDLSRLSEAKNIKLLAIEHIPAKDFSVLSKLKRLLDLKASCTSIAPKDLEKINKGIKTLSLYGINFSETDFLFRLKKLEYLMLSSSRENRKLVKKMENTKIKIHLGGYPGSNSDSNSCCKKNLRYDGANSIGYTSILRRGN